MIEGLLDFLKKGVVFDVVAKLLEMALGEALEVVSGVDWVPTDKPRSSAFPLIGAEKEFELNTIEDNSKFITREKRDEKELKLL